MKIPLRFLVTALLAYLAASPWTIAQQTIRKLTDLNTPGEWVAYQWNTANCRLLVRPEFPVELGGKGDREESLGVKVSWPGGEGFFFSSITPANAPQFTIPHKLLKVSLWVKGSGTGHFLEMHFTHDGQDKDLQGKLMKVSLDGAMRWNNWRRLEATIPADWPQPLAIHTITQHSWKVPTTIESTTYFTRLEVTVDASQPVTPAGGASSSTNDDW